MRACMEGKTAGQKAELHHGLPGYLGLYRRSGIDSLYQPVLGFVAGYPSTHLSSGLDIVMVGLSASSRVVCIQYPVSSTQGAVAPGAV